MKRVDEVILLAGVGLLVAAALFAVNWLVVPGVALVAIAVWRARQDPDPPATAPVPQEVTPYESPLFDRLKEGLVVVELDGTIRYCNESALNQLPTLAVHRALPGELRPALDDGEVELSHRGREYRAVAQQLDQHRRLVVITDRTREVRLQNMKTDFVASASHELKTPAAAIRVAADALLLALDNDPESAKRFAVRIEEQSERLAEIVGDLLDLSRLETEEFEVEPCALDRIALAEVAGSVPPTGVELKTKTAEIRVMGSAADISLAVRNLIDNALRYTEEGTVNVGVHEEGQNAIVTVADTGIGIPRRSIDRIFERFYRADKARDRESGGTGLGLAIVKHVAERHGGSIEVESELGVGSTFRLQLPIDHP